MAITRVQKVYTSNSHVTSLAATVSSTGVGEAIIVALGFDNLGGSSISNVTSVTDNQSNTYVQATGARGGTGQEACTDLWYCLAPTPGVTTVTVTFPAQVIRLMMMVATYTGISTFVTGGVHAGNSACASNTITPSEAGSLLIGIAESTTLVISGVNAPFTGDARNTVDPIVWYERIGAPLTAQQAVITPDTTGTSASATLVEFAPPVITTSSPTSMFLVF